MKSSITSIAFFLLSAYVVLGSTFTTYHIPPGCQDLDEGCDSRMPLCKDLQVRRRCPQTCRVCPECYDYKDCTVEKDIWKQCTDNKIDVYCQASCDDCELTCRDKLSTKVCRQFASDGLCKDEYVKEVCKVSCGYCEPVCSNILTQEHCDYFKNEDKCDNDYAQKYCNKTCTDCHSPMA